MLTSQNFGSYVNGVAFHPTKNILASCSYDSTIKLWNTDTGEELSTLRGHDREVLSVSWSPDGTRLASGSKDWTVRIWEVATGKEVSQLKGHSKDNEECTCKHDAGLFKDENEANPDCPVRGHRYVLIPKKFDF